MTTTPPPVRICTTCGATMIQVTPLAWICPRQRTEGNGISAALRARLVASAAERIQGVPF